MYTGSGDDYLRAGSPMITDKEAAYAELEVLSRRIGWYAMYTACVRYVKEHAVVVPSKPEAGLFFEAAQNLKIGVEEREKRDAAEFAEKMKVA